MVRRTRPSCRALFIVAQAGMPRAGNQRLGILCGHPEAQGFADGTTPSPLCALGPRAIATHARCTARPHGPSARIANKGWDPNDRPRDLLTSPLDMGALAPHFFHTPKRVHIGVSGDPATLPQCPFPSHSGAITAARSDCCGLGWLVAWQGTPGLCAVGELLQCQSLDKLLSRHHSRG